MSAAPGSSPDFTLSAESWTGAAATALRALMDAEIGPRYADILAARSSPPPPVDPEEILVTLILRDGAVPAATTSLKRSGEFAEVKRVYVDPRYRRFGLAARLLQAIEAEARQRGYRELVLQTGARQPEAMALYTREGWQPIAPFGPYRGDDAISRCYRKPL